MIGGVSSPLAAIPWHLDDRIAISLYNKIEFLCTDGKREALREEAGNMVFSYRSRALAHSFYFSNEVLHVYR